jgi:hypothetical protein
LALGEELPARSTSVQNAHGTSDLPKMPTRRSLGWKEGLSGECRFLPFRHAIPASSSQMNFLILLALDFPGVLRSGL